MSIIKELSDRIRDNIGKVIIGKEHIIDMVLVALFSGGHVLVEDVPGLGKTMLAKSLSRSIGCKFKRIQFTPDLLPGDLTGISVYNQKETNFVFRPGPLFSNIVLADEINRATPRTQSALLECMEEHQITVEGNTSKLEEPFFVIATQNPLETQGTFPLPEAQMDRFFVRLGIGFPSREESVRILDRFEKEQPLETMEAAATAQEILEAREAMNQILVSDAVKEYIVDITEATRTHPKLILGLSPRGSISLMKAARSYAALKGRDYVIPSDVKAVGIWVIAHRVMLRGRAITMGGKGTEEVIQEIFHTVPVPIENIRGDT